MKRFHWIEIGVLVLLITAIVLCCVRLTRDKSDLSASDNSRTVFIPLEDAALSEETINGFCGVRKTYTFSLPTDGSAGDFLILYASHQYCTVRVDGETRFSYEDSESHFIRTSGRYWACIRLGLKDSDKPVEVQLTPVHGRAPAPEIRVCQMNRLIASVLSGDFPFLFLGLMCAILGLSLFLITLCTIFDRHTKRALLSLSMLTIAAGVWKVAELPVTTLLLRSTSAPLLQPKAVYLYGMIAFLLMPVFTIQYLNGMRRSNKLFPDMLCEIVMALTAVVVLALQLTGRLELYSTTPFLMTESAALMLVMCYLIFRQRDMRWLVCFPLSAGADLLITRLSGSARYAICLIVCILVSDYISGVIFVRRTIRQKSELRDARTTVLLNQIRPHFVHNTLTSIYYLCDSDPQAAKRLVHDFNKHLRASFTALTVKAPINFDEEMENVRAYLSVVQVRFSDKLFVEYDTPHTAFRLPALTLQPLVENAVKHNVDSSKPPVHICIRSMKTESGSTVIIEDDGAGISSTPQEDSGHVGLHNVADRLQMLCGGTLTVSPREGGGTVVTVFIPD